MKTAKVKAHTNIALIKYWGKKDQKLFLPMNSSLSLTLDAFYTETTVQMDDSLSKDQFILNDCEQSEEETKKISRFLDLFREETGIYMPTKVISHNHVPTAAGLASSASAFAALGGAMNVATGMNADLQTLSTFVRRGSGSATRSVYGGFVEWQMGTSNDDSYAVQIDDANWDIAMVTVAVNTNKKTISSRVGMQLTVETSPFYESWLTTAKTDLADIKQAIQTHDFQMLGEITESNGMKMHGTMLGARPPFTYMEPTTLDVIAAVRQLRQEGIECYYTMDAGPNVKVLCHLSETKKIQEKLKAKFPTNPVIISKVGSGIELLS